MAAAELEPTKARPAMMGCGDMRTVGGMGFAGGRGAPTTAPSGAKAPFTLLSGMAYGLKPVPFKADGGGVGFGVAGCGETVGVAGVS
jgi:hypothetical protein